MTMIKITMAIMTACWGKNHIKLVNYKLQPPARNTNLERERERERETGRQEDRHSQRETDRDGQKARNRRETGRHRESEWLRDEKTEKNKEGEGEKERVRGWHKLTMLSTQRKFPVMNEIACKVHFQWCFRSIYDSEILMMISLMTTHAFSSNRSKSSTCLFMNDDR